MLCIIQPLILPEFLCSFCIAQQFWEIVFVKWLMLAHVINEAQSSVTLIDPVLTATGAFRYDPHSVFIASVSSTENYRLIGLERTLRGQTVFIATIR